MDEGLTDDQRPLTGAAWYEDRTSLLADAESLTLSLRSALEEAETLRYSPAFDESYKVRASRIDRTELRGLAARASALCEEVYALAERARKTWIEDAP